MKKISFLLLIFIGFTKLIAQQKPDSQTLQTILYSQLNQDIPGILLHIQSGNGEINWSSAAGVADLTSGKKLLPNQTFRIASVTKTFVAASILRLWEESKLRLEDRISKYISTEHADILSQDYNL